VDLPTLGIFLATCISATGSILIKPFGSLVILFGLRDKAYNWILFYATENDQEEIFTEEKASPDCAKPRYNSTASCGLLG
jgi:hypothetical protein